MAIEEVNNQEEEEENDFFDYAGDILAAPFRGVEGALQGAYNLVDYLAFDVLPDYDTRFLGTSKTMAGGAVEGIAQFATGFVPLFGLAGRAGALARAGKATQAVVAGAATDFTFFNGQEARLSNLIQQVPELQNPVTEFLAYDGDESELEGRMKNVLEGLGLEAVAGGFIASLKAIKRGRKVKEGGGTAEQQAQVVNDTLEGGKVFAEMPEFREKGIEPELQERIEEVGGETDLFEDLPLEKPRPYKTYKEEGLAYARPKGADYIKTRLMKRFPVKGADEADIKAIDEFIDRMGEQLFDDTSISITNKLPTPGRFTFAENLIEIRQSAIEEGKIKRTMVHELWHNLSRYLPSEDVKNLTKQFNRERNKYINSFGVDIKNLDEAFDPASVTTKELPEELSRFLRGGRGDFTRANYRFKDIDEYFAEEMTDAWLKKADLEEGLAPKETFKRLAQDIGLLFKQLFASLKAKLGIDQRQKIFNDFLTQRNIKVIRERPIDPSKMFAEMGEFKKGKEAEFVQAVPSKFRGYADELLKGGTPRLPQFALETGDDVVVLKEVLEGYYKENPDKITVEGAITDIDTEIEQQFMLQQGKDAATKIAEARVVQQSLRDQAKGVIENLTEAVDEYKKAGGGSAAIAKLKNNFQQLLNVADIYRQIGRETGITLQARRENFRARKIGLSQSDIEIEGLRNQFINASGGMHPDKLVDLIRETIDKENPDSMIAAMFKIAKQAQGKHFLDMPTEYWMNAILSGPKTQMVNIMGNGLTQVMSTLEAIAGGVVTGNMGLVKAVVASWADGQMISEAAKFAKKAFKQNDNLLDPQARAFSDRPQGAITGERIASGRLGGIVTERGLTSKKAFDAMGNFIRIPSRLLLTSDEFFKQLAYRRAARLKATMSGIQQGIKDPKQLAEYVNKTLDGVITEGGRMASEEGLAREAADIAVAKKLEGVDRDKFILKYVKENFDKNKSALMQYAQDEAQYLTFTRELQDKTLGKVLQEATNKLPMLRLVLPFVRTPTNILKYAFERTPGIVVLREERQRLFEDLRSGDPVRRSQAVGKMMTCIAVAGVFIDTIYNNRDRITGGGPRDEKKKAALMATGWRPYSIKIGDTYFSYQRLDPLATLLGVGADLVEVGLNEPRAFDESGVERTFLALTLSITRNATNKSYLAGIQNFTDALSDPDRYMAKFGQNFTSSFVPNIISQMADYDTQALREVRSINDAFARKLGVRSGLDKKRNLLGEEYLAEQWMGTGFINPIAMSPVKDDPVLAEMASLNHAFRQPPPNLGGQIDMLAHENESGQTAYDRQLELLQSVKVKGETLRSALTRLVKSNQYQSLEPLSEPGLPSPRVQKINSLLTRYRKEAKRQMLTEFPELAQQYSRFTAAQAGIKGGMQREDVLELLTQ
jgi:hypothetical protein